MANFGEGKIERGRVRYSLPSCTLDLLFESADEQRRSFGELEQFPSITRDIAMIVPEEIAHEKILRTD